MRIFKISKSIEVVCNYEKTRNGFRHLAILFIDGTETSKAKVCYLNRTWEKYEFQSVLQKVINESDLSDDDKKSCNIFIEGDQTDWSELNSIGIVAKMGELFCENQKDKNDWKKRMLKAGLENKGLDVPEDWETLSEDEKEKRLNKVIELTKGGD